MIKNPLIIGAKGNMGRRYASVLKSLGFSFLGIDVGDAMPPKGYFDGVIIASPTYMHLQHIRKLWDYEVPILCEKPITKDLGEILELCADAEKDNLKLRMVNQYKELVSDGLKGETYYDYFKTGSDGLAWDCISIIALAKGAIKLQNTSPIWTCRINGETIPFEKMDTAYCNMLLSWLSGEIDGIDYIRRSHVKVGEHLNQCPVF